MIGEGIVGKGVSMAATIQELLPYIILFFVLLCFLWIVYIAYLMFQTKKRLDEQEKKSKEPEEPEEHIKAFALTTTEIILIASVAVAIIAGIVVFWALKKRTKET